MTKFNLEERTLKFAISVRSFINRVKYTLVNQDDCRQLLRASGSVGANYIEANEGFSKKDFLYRCKISRKESKECIFWFQCLENNIQNELEAEREVLLQEATELMKIFGSIIRKTKD